MVDALGAFGEGRSIDLTQDVLRGRVSGAE